MAWTAEVTQVYRDTVNFNIVAEITYTNDVTGESHTERLPSVDLTNEAIAEQARKRIRNVFEPGDAALAAVALGAVRVPDAPVQSDAEKAVMEKSVAFQAAVRDAQIAALNSPTVDLAYADLKAAQAAVQAAAVEVAAKG